MRKKSIIFIIGFALTGIIAVFVTLLLQEQDSLNSLKLIIHSNEKTEKICIYESDKYFYAFLPSFANLEDTMIEYTPGNYILLDDVEIENGYQCDKLSFDEEYTLSAKCFLGWIIKEKKFVIKKSVNIPSVFVDLVDGTIADINKDKETKKTGAVRIITEKNLVDFSGSFKSFSGRGNGTWQNVKKPYNIEFEMNTVLLGMKGGKKYSFLADSLDYSHLRNKLAYDAAIDIGLPYAVDSRYVDLYVNGEYLGLYLMTESVEVGENRISIADLSSETASVNQFSLSSYNKYRSPSYVFGEDYLSAFDIPNNPDNITGGYLLEYQFGERAFLRDSFFKTKSDIHFSLKSPMYASKEQIKYISDYYQQVEASFSTDDFEEWIDVDSWVKFYLIQECFGNTDLGSEFFYKDKNNNKLYAGPIWDFDISMGNNSNCDYNTAGTLHTCKDFHSGKSVIHPLYENKRFYEKVVSMYKDSFRSYLQNVMSNKIQSLAEIIRASLSMDKLRWKDIQNTYQYQDYLSVESNVNYLTNWMQERISFLDDVWIDNHSYYTVLLESSLEGHERERYYFSVSSNASIDNEPILQADGYEFLGWFDSVTGEKLDDNSVINDDKTFFARWSSASSSSSTGLINRITRLINTNSEYFSIAIIGVVVLAFIGIDCFKHVRKHKRR